MTFNSATSAGPGSAAASAAEIAKLPSTREARVPRIGLFMETSGALGTRPFGQSIPPMEGPGVKLLRLPGGGVSRTEVARHSPRLKDCYYTSGSARGMPD